MAQTATAQRFFPHAGAAFLWACRMDVAVRKPGNVSLASPGHDMEAGQFLLSAEASAPALFRNGAAVGDRIEGAVRATREAVGCNTNLGILLLCAPLALAAERAGGGSLADLQQALTGVLDELDLDDARAAYRAIRIAAPGGLGDAGEQDVAAPPTVDLRAAMRLAADRDLIACQYADGYRAVLAAVRAHFPPRPAGAEAGARALAARVQYLFVRLLAAHPDSHIARKYGAGVAAQVSAEALAWRYRLAADLSAVDGADFVAWDAALKARGLNPGTTADLTVCTLFVAALVCPAFVGCGGGAGQAAPDSWPEVC